MPQDCGTGLDEKKLQWKKTWTERKNIDIRGKMERLCKAASESGYKKEKSGGGKVEKGTCRQEFEFQNKHWNLGP